MQQELKQQTFLVSPEVASALQTGRAVVALESTIITHGMPYPQNYETAKSVETVVRDNGAVPATIAVIHGAVHIGLTDEELRSLSAMDHSKVIKASRRDLAYAISSKLTAGTTVSATSLLAVRLGISVFVTGGTGGVHRGFEETMDVSADLTELGRTPICVVSAGVKSLLDIPRTLEFLETQGVSVIGFDTDEFPAFFTRHSGVKVPLRLNNSEQVAMMIEASVNKLHLQSGILVGVPIPTEYEADGAQMEAAIQTSLKEMHEKHITGRDVTPFILQRVNELTKGKSLESNIALVKNNAKVGSQIAVALSNLRKSSSSSARSQDGKSSNRVVVVGGAIVDLVGKSITKFLPRTSNPGRITMQFGGVGRNIAEALARLGLNPLMITAVGRDVLGDSLIAHMKSLNMSVEGIIRPESTSNSVCDSAQESCENTQTEYRTALYNGVMDEKGEQVVAIVDTEIIDQVTPAAIMAQEKAISQAEMVVFDGNLALETIATVVRLAAKHHVPILFEPTSVTKSVKPITLGLLKTLDYITPNQDEIEAMARAVQAQGIDTSDLDMTNWRGHVAALQRAGAKNIMLKLGADGVVSVSKEGAIHIFPPLKIKKVTNVVGAGDSCASGMIWGIVMKHRSMDESIAYGLRAAFLSLQSLNPISPLLNEISIQQIANY